MKKIHETINQSIIEDRLGLENRLIDQSIGQSINLSARMNPAWEMTDLNRFELCDSLGPSVRTPAGYQGFRIKEKKK